MAAGAAGGSARAADWPQKTVTWIVPYPAGGGSDTFARPVAAAMADKLSQSMVIDNKSGAGGTVGTAVAARAPADGSTLLLGDTGLTYAPTDLSQCRLRFRCATSHRSARSPACPTCWWSIPAKLNVSTLAGLHRGGQEGSPAPSISARPASAP